MSSEIDSIFSKAHEELDRALDHLRKELSKVRTGKASTAILDGIMVNYYGAPVPVSQVANISVSDTRTINIQPWEKKMIQEIEHAIFAANLGLTPQNDGELIRISIPPLTEERRKEFVKQVKHYGEEARVSIRTSRHKVLDSIKREQKNGLSEDIARRKEQDIQNLITDFTTKIDKIVEAKEKEIMTV
ncbi:MAG: Ribosome-recycling factor [Saprospiraceae bacterium]|jgi:ribosome recycling factor|nr:Ribosome-recycling factor [Saprospiraceae bacterium]